MTMTELRKPAAIGTSLDGPAIYIACLASYNDGILHGFWCDLTIATTAEEIQECIDYVLATSTKPGAEEYAIHDQQLLAGPLTGTEWPDLNDIESYLDVYNALDDTEQIAYRICCNDNHQVLCEDDFREMYCGVFDSPSNYAYDLAESLGHDIDGAKWPFSCIDWERAWRELDCDGYSAEFNSDAGGYIITRPC